MRWILIILLMCNGIFFLWQNYLQRNNVPIKLEVEQRLPDGASELVLLSESPQGAVPRAAGTATAGTVGIARDEVQSPPVEVRPICWRIGPFREEVSGKQVISRLDALDIHLQLNAVEVQDKPDFWVHMPPQPSRREAIKLLRELQSKKIDSFLITEGELADGISLGFFTQQDRAEAVLSQRRKQGYPAEIKLIPRTHTELWAVFNEGEYGKFSDALWEKITEGNQGLERRKNYCDTIASTENIE